MAKVLIVEDAPFIREMIRDILESHDHEIAGEAANGLEAIEKYKALKPDVVLMDILMPGMDGLSAIMKIMEQDPKARIIVVSALVKEALRKEAMRAGAILTNPRQSWYFPGGSADTLWATWWDVVEEIEKA